MANPPDDLAALSTLALELHRAAVDTSPDAFQRWALGRLATHLPFDAAFWASGHFENGLPVVHNFVLTERPAELLADYAQVSGDDVLGAMCAATPGTAFVSNRIAARTDTTPRVAQYLEKWRIAHAVSCHTFDRISGLLTAISLWREPGADPFAEDARRFFEAVVPHLNASTDASRLRHVQRSADAHQLSSGGAVADPHGVLQLATPDFTRLLAQEWPDWRGPRLPDPLTHLLSRPTAARHAGARTIFLAAPSNDLFFIRARTRCPADGLSRREVEVTQMVIGGLTRREISARLGIAPSTVRNHLTSVFLKLNVRKQSELARHLPADL